jgi:hypothetical protein
MDVNKNIIIEKNECMNKLEKFTVEKTQLIMEKNELVELLKIENNIKKELLNEKNQLSCNETEYINEQQKLIKRVLDLENEIIKFNDILTLEIEEKKKIKLELLEKELKLSQLEYSV